MTKARRNTGAARRSSPGKNRSSSTLSRRTGLRVGKSTSRSRAGNRRVA